MIIIVMHVMMMMVPRVLNAEAREVRGGGGRGPARARQ